MTFYGGFAGMAINFLFNYVFLANGDPLYLFFCSGFGFTAFGIIIGQIATKR